MYARRVQLVNYGPIDNLDIEFPFDGETPKPVVLVGENGSGKSVLLSHIVNGLVLAKGIAYPETPEIEQGKAYKTRSSSYIKSGSEYYFARVDFSDQFFISEMRTRLNKQEYSDIPAGILGAAAEVIWGKLGRHDNDHVDSNFSFDSSTTEKIKDVFAKNCILYFPFNRFEEPAWLNEENLISQAQYSDAKAFVGYTNRKVIASSPLHENQNWLFDVAYDRAVFELHTRNLPVNLSIGNGSQAVPLPLFLGYIGNAASTFETALQIVRIVTRNNDATIGIGRRNNRSVSIQSASSQSVPNIFQMSSGETSLLNLFLSILRDFDLAGAPFSQAADIQGIAVIDEVDLHLHVVHQHEILPELIKMFPRVQFVVTTHSPLVVLGIQKAFGADGFGVYRLPQGHQISPEQFSEFGNAYQAFATTRTFNEHLQTLIEESQKPIVFVEGATDQRYVEEAARLLGKESVLAQVELRDGGGKGNLSKIWKDSVLPLTEALSHKIVLLFDCDTRRVCSNKGRLLQRSIPLVDEHPVQEGIENLVSKSTLDVARRHKGTFFSTEEEHGGINDVGQPIRIPEKWSINRSDKMNLCDWLCANSTADDFRHFGLVFDVIEEALDWVPSSDTGSCTESTR